MLTESALVPSQPLSSLTDRFDSVAGGVCAGAPAMVPEPPSLLS